MAHAIGGHPIHWHVDPTIKQEIAHYNARRRKNLAGWGALDSLNGDGYKVSLFLVNAPLRLSNINADTSNFPTTSLHLSVWCYPMPSGFLRLRTAASTSHMSPKARRTQ